MSIQLIKKVFAEIITINWQSGMQGLTDQEGRIAMWDGRFPGLASKQAKCATAGGDDARRTSKFGRDLFYWFASDIALGKLDVFFPGSR